MTSRRAAGLLPPSARRFIFCVLTDTTANSLMAKNALEAMSMTCRNKLGRTVSIKIDQSPFLIMGSFVFFEAELNLFTPADGQACFRTRLCCAGAAFRAARRCAGQLRK